MTAFPPTPEPDKGIEITDTEKRGDPMTIPPAAVIALRALRSIVNEDPADRVLRDWQVEANEYLDRLDALLARIEPQDCGLSANDIYHVMLAWEQQPASDEQTRIVTGLGKLREQFIQRGDSPYVTVPATARVEPQESTFNAELALRQEWWLGHGCPPGSRYSDDGEMQCNSAGCLRDFKREPLHELAAHVDRLRQQRAAAAYTELRSAVARVES